MEKRVKCPERLWTEGQGGEQPRPAGEMRNVTQGSEGKVRGEIGGPSQDGDGGTFITSPWSWEGTSQSGRHFPISTWEKTRLRTGYKPLVPLGY